MGKSSPPFSANELPSEVVSTRHAGHTNPDNNDHSTAARSLIKQQSYVNHMYGKHIDKLTSELIANLTKGISLRKRIGSAVTEPVKRVGNGGGDSAFTANEFKSNENKSVYAQSEYNDDDEESDYEDIRAGVNEFYEMVDKKETVSEPGNAKKIVNDIEDVKFMKK